MPRPLPYDPDTMNRASVIRTINLLALIAVSSLASLIAISGHGTEGGETVQIIARLQADGDIEFGLRTSEGNQLPRLRVFSAAISDEGWRESSLVELSDGTEVRIIARRDGETRVEFGLRIDEPRQEFLPTRRYFPRASTVGAWRSSTPILLPAREQDDEHDEPESLPESVPEPDDTDDDTGEGTTDEASDVERISGTHRDGLIVEGSIVGDPDAPVLIVEYGDPF